MMGSTPALPGHGLPTADDLEVVIVDAVVTKLTVWLKQAKSGLCARLDDLPLALMTKVAQRLYAQVGASDQQGANVRLLSQNPQESWECHWTEAVRLRNPDDAGKKRLPFLLLVPPGSQLLGSLDTDTFVAIPCENIVRDIVRERARLLPQDLAPVNELINRRDLIRSVSDLNRARYLLALEQHGYSRESAGNALCLLGLWPHRRWLETGDQRDYWLTKNKEVMSRLRGGSESLYDRLAHALKLSSAAQTRRLYDLLSSSSSLEAAAEQVATDPSMADLDFGKWEFASQPETVVINLDPLVLPRHEDGYPVLRLREQQHLQLSWSTDPTPSQVPDLTNYLVQLISTSADSVIYEALTSEAITPGKSARKRYTLKNLLPLVRQDVLPEGLYRARVSAWARATNITRQPGATENAPNISEYFWIKDEGVDEPPVLPTSRDRSVTSYLEARREVQWALLERKRDPWALPDSSWTWDGAVDGKAVQSTCALKFGQQAFRIRMSNLLRRIETTILANPSSLGAFRADLNRTTQPQDLSLALRTDVPHLAADDAFLKVRAELFAKIKGENSQGTVETSDLLGLRSNIVQYAKEYISLLTDAEQSVTEDPKKWPDRVGLADIDTIKLTLQGLSDETSVALLLAPTHPLRLLWALQLALLGEAWLREAWQRGSADSLTLEARQALSGGLRPTNFPPVLFDRRRVGYVQAGIVAPGWDVYLPSDIGDKQSALFRLSRALGYGGRPITSGSDTAEICDRVARYLEQHPYVSLLQMNVFNPGDGLLVADMLAEMDKQYPDLRYEVRLFAHDKIRDDLGDALDQLVNPEVTVGEAAEKYSQSGKYPLHPNLTYSKNRVSDFLANPRRFQAHLSLLLDMFHPRIDVLSPFPVRSRGRLGGLVQEETVKCHGEQGTYAWERQVVVSPVHEISQGACEAKLLSEGLEAIQHFVAALGASPSMRQGQLPTIRLDLSVDGQSLLYEIHRISDWVLISDRHLGIDYFDSAVGDDKTSPGILLDFSPEFPSSERPLLMLTTRVDKEIEGIVVPVLQRLGLDQPGAAPKVVEWLRSLSGRLAIRLLSAPLAAQGIMGMALARAFLGEIGMLQDAVVIPVDAHIQLLGKGRAESAPEGRTDLILARRVGETRQIELVLVEVKCKGGVLTPAAYNILRDEMETQVAQTQAALTSLFDREVQSPDRIDRPLRNLTLSNWLRFYVGRARRYGLLSEQAENKFLNLLTGLDDDYSISFRQAGLVFELGRDEDLEDSTSEFRVHRIGRSSCERLLHGDQDTAPEPITWDRARDTLRERVAWARIPAGESATRSSHLTAAEDGGRPPTTQQGRVTEPGGAGAPSGVAPAPAEDSSRQSADVQQEVAVGALKPPQCHYLVGDTQITPQWGILGKLGADTVALDLNGSNTLSVFGVQGGGKSYTMGSILEMAVQPLAGVNLLPSPLAAVVFHYNESQDYPPEFVTMADANSVTTEVMRLRQEYGGEPEAVGDILVLTSGDKVARRQEEFPGLAVEPIGFSPSELTIQDWQFLMGAVGNDSLYIREFNLLLRSLRDNITIEALRQGIEDSQMSEAQRKLARLRLRFAEQFVRDGEQLRGKLYPGRLVIVDLRDEFIETDEALGLFVVMLRVFAGSTHHGQSFNKIIAFDEAHKYIRNSDLVDSVVAVIRQMRHQGTSVIIASQDPPSLPLKIMELSSVVMLHRMDSPAWLKHIQKAVTSLGDLTAPALARLRPGEAYLWARTATDPMFTLRAVKIQCRPRATQHGGATKTANASAPDA